jgi:hypothetical protein
MHLARREIPMKISAASQLVFLRENLSTFAVTRTPLWHPLGLSLAIFDDPGNIIVRVIIGRKESVEPKIQIGPFTPIPRLIQFRADGPSKGSAI